MTNGPMVDEDDVPTSEEPRGTEPERKGGRLVGLEEAAPPSN